MPAVEKKKYRYTDIAAVVAIRQKDDEEPEIEMPEDTDEEKPATYRGAYVLISNHDAPDEYCPWCMLNAGESRFSFAVPNKT